MSFSYTNHSDTSAPNYQQTLEEAQEIMLSAAKVVTSLLVYLLALSISLLTLSLYLLSICFPAESCSYLRPTSNVCRYTTAMVSLAEWSYRTSSRYPEFASHRQACVWTTSLQIASKRWDVILTCYPVDMHLNTYLLTSGYVVSTWFGQFLMFQCIVYSFSTDCQLEEVVNNGKICRWAISH